MGFDMPSLFHQFLNLIPEGGAWLLIATLGLLVVGWISTIVLTARTKWLALLAFFPPTHPLALIAMVLKQGSASLVPLGAYALAAVTWFSGSQRIYQEQLQQLEQYEQALKADGEPLGIEGLKQRADQPEENIWDHPFLKPLATAGTKGESGEQARKEMGDRYASLELPRTRLRIQLEKDANPERPGLRNNQEMILSSAIHSIHPEDALEPVEGISYPTDREAVLKALEPTIRAMEEDLRQLSEALSRPQQIYPHQWEEGFNMLLPQLAKLKAFSQATTLSTLYHTWKAEPEKAFQTAKLGLRTAEVRDSALLISCLVQIAQVRIAMNAIDEARCHHLWGEEEWVSIQEQLEAFRMIDLMDDSLRMERAIGHATMRPMVDRPPTEVMRLIQGMGQDFSGTPSDEPALWEKVSSLFLGRFWQACYARQWRLCLKGYQEMISDLNAAEEASQTKPWKDILVSWDPLHFKTDFGILAGMLLPALDKAQSKAVRSQVEITLTQTSIDLERYYLRQGHYPERLENLVPGWRDSVPVDPMTQEPLFYKSLSQGMGFELYSVGLNGEDDGGRYQTKTPRGGSRQADDLLLIHLPISQSLPKYQLGNRKG